MKYFIFTLTLAFLAKLSEGSVGDGSIHFRNCVQKCTSLYCEDDGVTFINEDLQQFHLQLFQWSCTDECQYTCMWKTVEAFENRGFNVPQFYGKWPFIRLWGIQEPASVLFSILNFYVNIKGLLRFRKEVKNDSPMYWIWHFFCLVCLNAWIWSTVFHTRDFPQTEFLDYSCAFSMVLMSCYCMIMRFLIDVPRFILITITVFFIAFYCNHVAYLRIGRFDYTYNMQVNILVGTFTAISWFSWAIYNRYRKPYVWKIAVFVSFCTATTILEVIDRPPLFYIIDCHALWHLSTVPLAALFYSFIVDDCNYLRKQKTEDIEKVLKED